MDKNGVGQTHKHAGEQLTMYDEEESSLISSTERRPQDPPATMLQSIEVSLSPTRVRAFIHGEPKHIPLPDESPTEEYEDDDDESGRFVDRRCQPLPIEFGGNSILKRFWIHKYIVITGLVALTVLFGVAFLLPDNGERIPLGQNDAAGTSGSIGGVKIYDAAGRHAETHFCQRRDDGFGGFTGVGYVDFLGRGAWVEFTVSVTEGAGPVSELEVKYSSASEDRPLDVLIDGIFVGELWGRSTSDWSTWSTEQLPLSPPLPGGEHKIRLFARRSEGPNVDWLALFSVADQVTPFPSTISAPSGVPSSEAAGPPEPPSNNGVSPEPSVSQQLPPSQPVAAEEGVVSTWPTFSPVITQLPSTLIPGTSTPTPPIASPPSDQLPLTQSPSQPIIPPSPTPSPSRIFLSPSPTPPPTNLPVAPSPTDPPTPSPTGTPTTSPTEPPLLPPTIPPTPLPTDPPVSSPTDYPVPLPTEPPTSAPTDPPVSPPTNLPVPPSNDPLQPEPLPTPPQNPPTPQPTPSPPPPPPPPPSPGYAFNVVLESGARLERGTFVSSPNGRYKFGLNSEGELRLLDGSQTVWKNGVVNARFAYMQTDGNFLARLSNSQMIWQAHTSQNQGAILVIDDGGQAHVRYRDIPLWVVGMPRGQYNGVPDGSLSYPLRGAFYYAWYPETWEVNGKQVFYRPSLGKYKTGDPDVLTEHVRALEYANVDVSIISWWGPDKTLDRPRIFNLLERSSLLNSDVKWTVYHEEERLRDMSVDELKEDLAYLKKWFAWHKAWAHVDGKPIIFVYNEGGCEVADRWTQAAGDEWYVVLKLFPKYKACPSQPNHWHQYGPATAVLEYPGASFTISPGFWRSDLPQPDLGRVGRERWTQAVLEMVNSGADWQLVTTFNEWGEGTAVEGAQEWASDSPHGYYMDALHNIDLQDPIT